MLLSDWIEIIVGLTAVYAAVLSTLNFLVQRRASKPQLKIDLFEETYIEEQDKYGQVYRESSRSRTLTRTRTQKRIDALKVIAKNNGQTDVVLKSWGVQLSDGRSLFSAEFKGDAANLQPRRHVDRELRFPEIAKLQLDPPPRRVRHIVGLYEDTLGNIYKSRRMKPSKSLKILIETQERRPQPSKQLF